MPIAPFDRMRHETGARIGKVSGAPVVVKVRFNAVRHDACAVVPARDLADGQGFSNRSMTNTTKEEREATDSIISAEVDGVLQLGILIREYRTPMGPRPRGRSSVVYQGW